MEKEYHKLLEHIWTHLLLSEQAPEHMSKTTDRTTNGIDPDQTAGMMIIGCLSPFQHYLSQIETMEASY